MSAETTPAIERAADALSGHDLFGCDCCTDSASYDKEHPDGCPEEYDYVYHTYQGSCRHTGGRTPILAGAALAAALDVEEMARVIAEHRFLPKGRKDCRCGWSGGDMYPTTPHEDHLATVLRAAILGAAS